MNYQQNRKLSVENLTVEFQMGKETVQAVNGIDLEVPAGKITALVGESGSGKSVTSLAIMDLLPANGKVSKGTIQADGSIFSKMEHKQRQKMNGTMVGMIFQDPFASLDPLYTVGNQMMEGILSRCKINKKEAAKQAEEYLMAVNLQNPRQLMKKYPFELSGGMCQRVMIAVTMALQPAYLIADEPTTALDVTVQRQILNEIYRLSHEKGIGILFITHDLGVVAEIADQVYIMKNGSIVERADVDTIFHCPSHAYTKQLIRGIL